MQQLLNVFAGVEDRVPGQLADWLRAVPLIDHHVHGFFTQPAERQDFEDALNEGATDPAPGYVSMFESPLGIAVRRWCAPLLGLDALACPDDYWSARSSMDQDELARIFLRSAGVASWLVDTGFASESISTPQHLSIASGRPALEIVRLEATMEALLAQVAPHDFPDALRHALGTAGPEVVGFKTVAAYRCGLDIDWRRPNDESVVLAAQRHLDSPNVRRVDDATLIAFGVHEALASAKPLQVHIGYGDRDLDLNRSDPLHLVPLLRARTDAPVLLLHCYPFHRKAAYLAQAFHHVHFDVGLAVNYLGSGSARLLAEAMELAPFSKQLYSSDAFGIPELHLLGSVLWRRGMGLALGEWVRRGDWSIADAVTAAERIASSNAQRVYGMI